MDYLLKASAVLLLFYVFYKIFLQKDTFFQSNRWFLLTGFLVACCIPLIVIPIYVDYTPIKNTFITGIPTTVVDSTEASFSWITALTWIYFLGVIFFTTRFLFEILSLSQVIFQQKVQKIGKLNFVESTMSIPPFSFFNWIVYDPSQFNDKELELIINHEKVHANQLHTIDILISHCVAILFWFNPIVWYYKKALQQNLEFITDFNAQNVSSCNSSYQKLLVKTSIKGTKLSLVNNFYNSLIKKRIVILHKNRSKRNNQWKPLLILPILAVFLMSFNTETIYIEREVSPKTNNYISDYSLNMDEAFHTYLGKDETSRTVSKGTSVQNANKTLSKQPVVKG